MLETQIGNYRKALVDLEAVRQNIKVDLRKVVLEELMPEVLKEVKQIHNQDYTPEKQVRVVINDTEINVWLGHIFVKGVSISGHDTNVVLMRAYLNFGQKYGVNVVGFE